MPYIFSSRGSKMRFSYANISALDSEKFMGISIGSRRGTQKFADEVFYNNVSAPVSGSSVPVCEKLVGH